MYQCLRRVFPAAGVAERAEKETKWKSLPGTLGTAREGCDQRVLRTPRRMRGPEVGLGKDSLAPHARDSPTLCKWAVSQRETDIRIRYAIQEAGHSTERMERPSAETRTTEGAHWARGGSVGHVWMKGRHECESHTWKELLSLMSHLWEPCSPHTAQLPANRHHGRPHPATHTKYLDRGPSS